MRIGCAKSVRAFPRFAVTPERKQRANGQRFTLSEPWSVLLLDDARVIHESTPIQPLSTGGWRDTLVLTLRAGGFQDESRLTA